MHDPAAPWKRLYRRIVADEPLAETVLIELSEARAQAIVRELSESRGLSLDRIDLKRAEALKPGKPVQADLTLEALPVKREKSPSP